MTRRRALDYAENNLGVHKVHEDARAARNQLDGIYTELDGLHSSKRDLQARIEDRELLVASVERGKHPDMSVTGMEKHLKIALNNDDELRELRDQLRQVLGNIEGREYDVRIAEHDIKIAVARMIELGGYFQYLAAVKTTPTTPEKPENST